MRTSSTPEATKASALIYNDLGEYLLHLRDFIPGIVEPGCWSFLGGGREPEDEDLEATIRRELQEEAGLDIPGLEPFALEVGTGESPSSAIQIFAGRWNGDPSTLTLTEGVMLHWFRPEVMPRLRLSAGTLSLIQRHARTMARP